MYSGKIAVLPGGGGIVKIKLISQQRKTIISEKQSYNCWFQI
jgi:hypothetical protein